MSRSNSVRKKNRRARNFEWREQFRAKKPKVIAHRMNAVEYAAYLKSPEWKEKRAEFLVHCVKAGKAFCYKCKTPAMPWFPVHHLNYRNAGRERFSDLRIVCRDCHKEIHPRLKNERS